MKKINGAYCLFSDDKLLKSCKQSVYNIFKYLEKSEIYAVSGYPAAAIADAPEVRAGRLRQELCAVIHREQPAHITRLCCQTHAMLRHTQEDSSPPASDSHTSAVCPVLLL